MNQPCPGQIGPIGGVYFCTSRNAGYCDRRSGTCFCEVGYRGVDCSECEPAYLRNASGSCLPKVLCPRDCAGGGTCNYVTGVCACFEYRTGADCSHSTCDIFDWKCSECDASHCQRCIAGWFPNASNACVPCTVYDPRCSVCDARQCFECMDPVLLSIRRSGRRERDSMLPEDELTREFARLLPFGTQTQYAFDEAEPFVIANVTRPLLMDAVSCDEAWAPGVTGLSNWTCHPFPISHVICGHNGTFWIHSPTYSIPEYADEIRVSVVRTGGGVGTANVSYTLHHLNTNNSDVTATAQYKTGQVLVFAPGEIVKSFLITINDDELVEANETFLLTLHDPVGGASLSPQKQAIVTIIDDDRALLNNANTTAAGAALAGPNVAGNLASFIITGHDYSGAGVSGQEFVLQVRDTSATMDSAENLDGGVGISDYTHTPVRRITQFDGSVFNIPGTGLYNGSFMPTTQGSFDLVVQHAKPGGLIGYYFDNPTLTGFPVNVRVDRFVNFNWGTGRVTPTGSDFVSARWLGRVKPFSTELYTFAVYADDNVRLWVRNELIIDRWEWPTGNSTGTIALTQGVLTPIRLEYRERSGPAFVHLRWATPTAPLAVIPKTALYQLRDIVGSPFAMSVIAAAPSASATGTRASGAGLVSVVAGDPAAFTITSRDWYSNVRGPQFDQDAYTVVANFVPGSGTDGASSEGRGSQEVAGVVAFDYGTYTHTVAYVPTVAGWYDLSVRLWADWTLFSDIYGSPFRVFVPPAVTNAAVSDASGSGLVAGVAGVIAPLTIVARDVYHNLRRVGGDVFTVVAYHTTLAVSYVGGCVDLGTGTYSCSYTPAKNGSYSLSVALGGNHVAQSPYSVAIAVAPTAGAHSIASGAGIRVRCPCLCARPAVCESNGLMDGRACLLRLTCGAYRLPLLRC